MRAALKPLRLPGFPNLATAYFVNELGNWLGEIALAVLVYDRTGSPLASAALFCAMQFVPAILGPPLVARLEPLNARRTLVGLYLAEAIGFGVLALLATDFALWAVILVALIDGAIASAARTLTRATSTAVLQPKEMLREGNAILNLGFTVGAAAGPALAGLVVAGFGTSEALAADAVSFLLVALILLSARGLPQPETDEGDWIPRLRRGIDYVREKPMLRSLLFAQAGAFVFFALVIPIEVVFAKETLEVGDAGYGALLAAWGVGMVLGSFLFAGLAFVRLSTLLVLSTAAIGVSYVATGISPTLAIACAAALLGGTGNGVQWVALVTAVQEMTERRFQGRVIAFLEALASAAPGIGFLAGGAIAALLDPRASYLVAGAGVIVVLAIAALRLRGADWDRMTQHARSSVEAGQELQVPVQTEGIEPLP
ncbi:MFS transporter [Thermoleophilia bacterium SCSIO 60948]|nr:MFS transporter [Thermoleophilia bacterium SCSIO 60948]